MKSYIFEYLLPRIEVLPTIGVIDSEKNNIICRGQDWRMHTMWQDFSFHHINSVPRFFAMCGRTLSCCKITCLIPYPVNGYFALGGHINSLIDFNNIIKIVVLPSRSSS